MTFSINGSQIFFANFVIFARNKQKNAHQFIVHKTTLYTYNPQPKSLPNINFLHLTVAEI